MNCLTTASATPAASNAMRISLVVASISAAVSRPRPRSAEKTCVSRSERVSNTYPGYRAGGGRWASAGQGGQDGADRGAAQGGVGQGLAVGAGHVEHVDDLGAERLDPGRAHVQAAFAQRAAHPPEQAGRVVGA